MKSQRIDKTGKEVPAPRDLFHSRYDDDEAYARFCARHSTPPHTRLWPHPSCNDDDNDEPGTIVPAVLGPPTKGTGTLISGPVVGNLSGVHSEEEYQSYFRTVATFHPGNWVCSRHYDPDTATLTKSGLHYILWVERDTNKIHWPKGCRWPKPFTMVNMGDLVVPGQRRWARLEDVSNYRHLTSGEYKRLIASHNVQLQDYIRQVKDSIEAGTLTVETGNP